MAHDMGTILVSVGAYTELGSTITQGGLVRIKNLGPGVAFVADRPTGSEGTLSAGNAADNAWPLSPGEEMDLRIPAAPVDSGAWVPKVATIGTNATIAYSVNGA